MVTKGSEIGNPTEMIGEKGEFHFSKKQDDPTKCLVKIQVTYQTTKPEVATRNVGMKFQIWELIFTKFIPQAAARLN